MAETKLLRINNKKIVVQSVALNKVVCEGGNATPEGLVKNESAGPDQILCSFENEEAAAHFENQKDLKLELESDGQPVVIANAIAFNREGRVVDFRGFRKD